jgi:titin
VTLSPSTPTGNSGPTAPVTGTSDSNGDVTFTITNTNTNSSSENYRVDQTTWSDPVGTQYKYEFSVSAVSGATAIAFSDNIWGHVVTTAAPAYSADVTLKSSTLVGPGAAVGNGWYHGNAPADNIVKYIVAGQSFNLVYHVADHTTGAPIVGKTLTLSAGGNATVSGSLTAVTNSSGDATFSLTSSNSSSEAELARPTGTENAWIPVDVVGGTEYKLDFSIASLSANGNIARGDNVWTHTVKAFSSSAALTGLYVKVNNSTTSAVIGWNAVSGASYKVTLTGMNGTKAFSKAITVAAGSSSTTVTGLPAGLLSVKASAYAYSDSTVASASTNGAVAALAAKTAAAPAAAPVITSLVAGVRKATVTYSPIQDASNGGATVTKYQYSTDLGATWIDAPASPFEITGLGNGAAVKVRMRAVNVVGNKASTDKAATTLNVPTAAPAMASAVGGVGTVTVTYSAVASTKTGGSAITGYQYTTNNGSTWIDAPASPFVISGLGNGVAVSVKMRAVNAVGNGVASAAAKTATTASAPKAAPAIVSVTTGTGKVTVKYTAVTTANNGGSAITSYQYTINNGSTWLTAGAAAGFDISAAKGSTVSVKMRAVNAVGASVASTAKANSPAVR